MRGRCVTLSSTNAKDFEGNATVQLTLVETFERAGKLLAQQSIQPLALMYITLHIDAEYIEK